MAEYIERNSAMEKILEIGDLNYDGMPAKIGTTHAALIIRNLPAAAVAPVRHGCWGKFSVSSRVLYILDHRHEEVVRCRECKHYHADTGWCDQLSYFQTSDGEPCSPAESMDWKMFQENDYCSMGQRKEAEHDVSES